MKLGKKDVISCLILKFLSSPPILVWTSRGTESIGDMIPSTPLDPKHYSLDHPEGYQRAPGASPQWAQPPEPIQPCVSARVRRTTDLEP